MKKFFGAIMLVVIMLVSTATVVYASHEGGLVPCHGSECNMCHFITMVHNVVDFIIKILIILSVILLAITGVQMATNTGNEDGLKVLKERLSNIVIGFLLVIAAWVIIGTILKVLVDDKDPLHLLQFWDAPEGELCDIVQKTAPVQGGRSAGPGGVLVGASGTDSHNSNIEALAPGITVTASGGCVDKTKKNCTSLDGLDEDVISKINEVAAACNCASSVVVTGGSEVGHEGGTDEGSHGAGDKFDLSNNQAVDNYIGGWDSANVGGRAGKSKDGVFCVQEYSPNHWDCLVS